MLEATVSNPGGQFQSGSLDVVPDMGMCTHGEVDRVFGLVGTKALGRMSSICR